MEKLGLIDLYFDYFVMVDVICQLIHQIIMCWASYANLVNFGGFSFRKLAVDLNN